MGQETCTTCGHDKTIHACGRHRSSWPCEHTDCECHDYTKQDTSLTPKKPMTLDQLIIEIGKIYEEQTEIAEMDKGYDGGEYSEALNDKIAERRVKELVEASPHSMEEVENHLHKIDEMNDY